MRRALTLCGLLAALPAALIINGRADRCDVYADLTFEGRTVLTERCVGALGLPLWEPRILSDGEARAWEGR